MFLAGGHTVPQTSPRARQPMNRNITGTSELNHLTSQHSSGYNSLSALEALASSNGFSLASDTSQNTTAANSSKTVISPKDFTSIHNNQWPSQQTCIQEEEEHTSIEMIDLNSQFSMDKASLDIGYQDAGYNLDTSITETLDSGVSVPPVKKGSIKNHTDRSLNKTNKQNEQDILLQDFTKKRSTSISGENMRITDNLNSSGENILQTSSKGNAVTIDLNNTVDLVYIDQSNNEANISSGFTPLKELQLCIPKLVITKIKERRGSKEIETHSVRTVMPGDEGEVPIKKKRRRSSEDADMQSDAELDKGIVLNIIIILDVLLFYFIIYLYTLFKIK